MIRFVILVASFSQSCHGALLNPVVDIPSVGKLEGNLILWDVWGHKTNVSEFLGIPYAEPPTGKRRFLPPFKKKPWKGVRNATGFGKACIQLPPDPTTRTWVTPNRTSEDCLYLNVWVPRSATQTSLPVYFWIHGGGYQVGTGANWNGTVLSAPTVQEGHVIGRGTIVVSINYRLGPFGFFHSPGILKMSTESGGPATNGGMNSMMDQLMALEWVNDHIAAFGGDPSQITIGGVSAGATSVCHLMYSPLAIGLFRGAILESGECTGPWGPHDDDAEWQNISNNFMHSVGASTLEELQKVAPGDILNSTCWKSLYPVVDGFFLKAHPRILTVAFKGSVIMGSTTMDNTCSIPFNSSGGWPSSTSEYLSWMSQYFRDDAAEVAGQYPFILGTPGQDPRHPTATPDGLRFLNATRDTGVSCPALWFARKLRANGNRVFLYEYGWDDGNVLGLWPFTSHGAESSYVWHIPPPPGYPPVTPDQTHVSNVLSAYWTSFVTHGAPKAVGEATVEWPEFQENEYLKLNIRQSPATGIYDKNCNFWDGYRNRGKAQHFKYWFFAQCYPPPDTINYTCGTHGIPPDAEVVTERSFVL